jgi:hypothetical protein
MSKLYILKKSKKWAGNTDSLLLGEKEQKINTVKF